MAVGKVISAQDAATQLSLARASREAIDSFTSHGFDINEEWAYQVQRIDRNNRISQGEKIVGAKLGLTSPAKQRSMKVDRPVVGFLTNAMHCQGLVSLSDFIQPRIEPELVFKTRKSISTAITATEVNAYIDSFAVGAEIIDSRYKNFAFSYEDVIADNTSAASFVVGDWHPWNDQDINSSIGSIAHAGGTTLSAPLSEILGNPLLTLVALSKYLKREELVLPMGSIILVGAMTDAIPLAVGEYNFSITGCSDLLVQVH